MRLLSLLLATAVSAACLADTATMTVEFGGTKAGSNVFEIKPDGTFSSNTDFSIGTLKITSVLSGTMSQGKITSFTLDQVTPGGAGKLVWDGEKATATLAGKTQEIDAKYSGNLYFANFHPRLNSPMLKAVDWDKKEPQKLDAFILDAARPLAITAKPTTEKSAKPGVARFYELNVGGTVIEYATNAQGHVVVMDVPAQRIRFIAANWESLYVDPLANYPELSQPTFKTVTERGVKMKTRDGVDLAMDIIRPEAPGKYPVILSRTPYGRASGSVEGPFYAARGYVFVSQDCRGRGESGGSWDPFVNEGLDGFDSIDWVSKQPWSDGNVGMIGASYGGLVQWAAAVERHPALKCIIPQVSPPDAMRNIPYDMGIFFLYGNLWWGKIVRGQDADMSGVMGPLPHPDKFGTLPLSRVDDAVLGYNVPFFDKWLERESIRDWQGFDWSTSLTRSNVPALHISGWWDGDLIGTQTNWATLRKAGRTNQWLIYGPWTHAFNTTSKLGDVDYGPTAIMELDSVYLRWFDTYLKGKEVGQAQVPKVRAFVTGANKWIDLEDWPSESSVEKTFYLYADAPANGKTSRGELRDRPAESQEPSRYLFNPAKAVIPKEMLSMDPDSATTVLDLTDDDDGTLIFKTAPLTKPMAIGGPIEVSIKFQTSAKDTDFYAMLVDIDEQGVMRMIGRMGKIRAAYLNGFDKVRPLTPNRTYDATIALWDTAHEFKAGHRLGLMITSGMFPMFARNLGTGEPIKEATRMVVQSNTIFHDRKNPSTLKLRVLW